jgi:hypothetical protein
LALTDHGRAEDRRHANEAGVDDQLVEAGDERLARLARAAGRGDETLEAARDVSRLSARA